MLPVGLIPLAYLDISEEARTGAKEAIQAFANAGVGVKIISSGKTADVLQLVQDLGMRKAAEEKLDLFKVLTGSDLADIDSAEQAPAVVEADVIASVTPEQHRLVIEMLEKSGEAVTMVGNSLADVPAMSEASLSISLHTSSQAAINTADIILQQNTLDSLVDVLHIGQRVVNGLLNILNLGWTLAGWSSRHC